MCRRSVGHSKSPLQSAAASNERRGREVLLERVPPDRNPSHALMGVPAPPLGTIRSSPVLSIAGETNGLEERQRDCRKFWGQAAIAIGGYGLLAGWNFCPKPEPRVPL
jgi:hypothetical protein